MSHVVVAPAAGGPAGASIKPRRRILQKLRDPIGSSVDVSGHLSTCVRFSSMFANDTASGYQTTSSVQEKSGEGGVQLRIAGPLPRRHRPGRVGKYNASI